MLYLNQKEFTFQTFQTIESSFILKLLKNVEVNRAVGIGNIPKRFLKDRTDILAISINQVRSLSIRLSHLPNN